jgi:peptidyl-dipeptidase Dcp
MKYSLITALTLSLILSACDGEKSDNVATQTAEKVEAAVEAMTKVELNESNPFFAPSSLFMQIPAFDQIKHEHYAPAFEVGMQEQLAEIDLIADNPDPATIANTLIPLEKSGQLLSRVARVFFALSSADTNDDIEELRAEMAPKLSAHSDAILLNGNLFKRVKTLHDDLANMELDAETQRLVTETYKDFVRSGAELSLEDKETLKDLNSRLASLQTEFSQNVKEEVGKNAIIVEAVEELDGLSDGQIASAAEAAKARDLEGKYVLPLLNTSGQPTMSSLTNRKLRERIHTTSLSRGSSGGEFDNREILTKVAKIRAERANLMGFDNHAAYSLSNQTAQTTEAVNKRLSTLAPAAVANAKKEAADLQKMIVAEGGDFELASWDWDFYTEKVRADRYNFDESQLKPYLEMENVLVNGVFFAAEKVFGITFKARPDLPTYNPDVKVWEVFDANGETLALFIEDFYARESKRGGAWMNA